MQKATNELKKGFFWDKIFNKKEEEEFEGNIFS